MHRFYLAPNDWSSATLRGSEAHHARSVLRLQPGARVTLFDGQGREGTAEINGGNGTYAADVADNGEPGRGRDIFTLTLSTGYTAGGAIEGGNIQLHCK